MNHEEALLDDVAAYALGAMPPEEVQRVRAHIDACAICRGEYQQLAPAVHALALDVDPALAPSVFLKWRILRATKERRHSQTLLSALAAACVALAVGLGTAFAVSGNNQAPQAQRIACKHRRTTPGSAGKRARLVHNSNVRLSIAELPLHDDLGYAGKRRHSMRKGASSSTFTPALFLAMMRRV